MLSTIRIALQYQCRSIWRGLHLESCNLRSETFRARSEKYTAWLCAMSNLRCHLHSLTKYLDSLTKLFKGFHRPGSETVQNTATNAYGWAHRACSFPWYSWSPGEHSRKVRRDEEQLRSRREPHFRNSGTLFFFAPRRLCAKNWSASKAAYVSGRSTI